MPSRLPWTLGCLLLPLTVACGSTADDSGNKSPIEKPPAKTPPEETTYGKWQELITGDWTMPPGEEGYVCARKTVERDMYVTSFAAINPFGTHHTLLTVVPRP